MILNKLNAKQQGSITQLVENEEIFKIQILAFLPLPHLFREFSNKKQELLKNGKSTFME